MRTLRVLVVGAGNAGLVAALALKKAGLDPVVYEAYEQPADRTCGGYLTVAVNGIDALRAIDAAHLVHTAGFACDKIDFLSGTSRFLGSVPMGPTLDDGTVTHIVPPGRPAGRAAPGGATTRDPTGRVRQAAGTRRDCRRRHRQRTLRRRQHRVGGPVDRRRRRALGHPWPHRRGQSQPALHRCRQCRRLHPYPRRGRPTGEYRTVWGRRCNYSYATSPQGDVWWFGQPAARRRAVPVGTAHHHQRRAAPRADRVAGRGPDPGRCHRRGDSGQLRLSNQSTCRPYRPGTTAPW